MHSALATPLNEISLPRAAYAASGLSPNTVRSYREGMQQYRAWCLESGLQPWPCSPELLAAWLSALADQGLSPATCSARCNAVAYACRAADQPDPRESELVKATLRGIRRKAADQGRSERRADALTPDLLRRLVSVIDRGNLRGLQHAALLTLGLALGARRSELVALEVSDISPDAEGMHVLIRRSKTDQSARGTLLYVPYANDPQVCAVVAVQGYLAAAKISSGPLFPGINKADRLRAKPMNPARVDQLVRRYTARAGLQGNYSAHSLCSGLITTLISAGLTEQQIMRQSRHQTSAMLRLYDRPSNLKQSCPLIGAY